MNGHLSTFSESTCYIINVGDPGRIISLALQILNSNIASSDSYTNYAKNHTISLFKKDGWFDVAIQVSDTSKYITSEATMFNADHKKIEFFTNEDHIVCSIFWSKQFKNFRQLLTNHGFINEESYLESLNKCILWKAPSGKSGSNFFKSYDNRFIIKELTSHEFECLREFIVNYINYITISLKEQRPSFLVKIFGAYEIICKGTHSYRLRFIVMENLLYSLPFSLNPSKSTNSSQVKNSLIFDLKGVHNTKLLSKSSPYLPGTIGTDAQFTIMSQTDPLLCTFQSVSIFHRAIERDTAFLSQQSIMDYSLLLYANKTKRTIFVGIIDFLRKYTWDKRLESVVKASVMTLNSNNTGSGPTIIHPEEYRSRFIEKMKIYFPPVPDKFTKYKVDFLDENALFISDDEVTCFDIDKSKNPFWYHEMLKSKYNKIQSEKPC